MELTDYARIAPYYDAVYGDYHDIGFYRNIARQFGEPILEVACGTGRVMLELVKLGCEVGGVDSSKALLDVLRKKVEKLPADEKGHIRVKQADMRDFQMERRYRLAIIPASSLLHLPSTKDKEQCLRTVFEHVINGGKVAVDVYNPEAEGPEGHLKHASTRMDGDGKVISHFISSKFNRAAKTDNTYHFIDVTDKAGATKRVTINYKFYYLFYKDLKKLLEDTGFRDVKLYGNYDLTPFDERKSPRIIAVATKE